MAAKRKEAVFTLEDLLEQIGQMKEMGPIDQLMGMIPGLGAKQLSGLEVDDSHTNKIAAIVNSMSPEERRIPEIIGGSRRKRIALRSATKVLDVNRLLKQFGQTRQMLKQFASPKGRKKRGMFSLFQ